MVRNVLGQNYVFHIIPKVLITGLSLSLFFFFFPNCFSPLFESALLFEIGVRSSSCVVAPWLLCKYIFSFKSLSRHKNQISLVLAVEAFGAV